MIRKSASWMEILDERMLEYLRENGPTSAFLMALAKGIDGSEDKVERHCELLRHVGLVSQRREEQFEITPRGRQYLDGDESAGELLIKNNRNPTHLPTGRLKVSISRKRTINVTSHFRRGLIEKLCEQSSFDKAYLEGSYRRALIP